MKTYRTSVTELYSPGTVVTARAAAAVEKGQFVALVEGSSEHPNINVAEAGGHVFGLAATDAGAGELVAVQRGSGRCFRVPAGAGMTAGALVEVGASGGPALHTTGVVVAQVLNTSTAEYVDLTLV